MRIYLLTMNDAHLNKAYETEEEAKKEVEKRQKQVNDEEGYFEFGYEEIEYIVEKSK